ncbi:MAG TPA: FlgB family protein [Paracoccaceae bacterium]|nr:FlgB family protein [Paracoccaceae bacterium]HMO73486.1 FlgB family protein [Paracoccaceae bacterium]
MLPKLEVTRMAQALAAHSATRLEVVAGNLAHADTPGYRAADITPFAEVWRSDASLRATRPGHLGGPQVPAAPERREDLRFGAPNGNTVSVEVEMVRAAEARQSHDMALSVYRAVSDITRAALGRGR